MELKSSYSYLAALVAIVVTLLPQFECAGTVESMNCETHLNDNDRAKLFFNFQPDTPSDYTIFAVNEDCYQCSWKFVANSTSGCVKIWTPFAWTFYLSRYNTSMEYPDNYYRTLTSMYSSKHTFGDQGVYTFNIDGTSTNNGLSTDSGSFSIVENLSPTDVYEPLYIFIALLLTITFIAFTYQPIWKMIKEKGVVEEVTTDQKNGDTTYSAITTSGRQHDYVSVPLLEEGQTNGDTRPVVPPKQPTKPKRLSSLDTFRGIALCIMIFVNYGGGGYWFFEHAAWNGLTVADLVFPWFMWIMGVSMALSFANILPQKPTLMEGGGSGNSGSGRSNVFNNHEQYEAELQIYYKKYRSVWWKATIRSIKLFLIGMFIANGYEYTTWRVPGVLQYFGVSYFVTASTILLFFPYTQERLFEIKQRNHDKLNPSYLNNEVNWDKERFWHYLDYHNWSFIFNAYYYEYIFQIMIVFLYLTIVFAAKVPGCPRGYNGPGGISEHSEHFHCVGGIHRYIDMHAFGYDFIYHHATCRELYSCPAYDPEGLLGVLSACTLTYLGLMTGRIFLHYKHHQDRLMTMGLWAMGILFLGGCLCGFSQNGGIMPVNKNLWSTSFVFVTAGLGLIGLSLCYIPIDIYHVWTGAPFLYLGMNSILIYVFHQLLQGYMPFSYMIYNINHGSLLLCHVMGVFAWVLIAAYFYRIKFFVKV